MTHIKNILYLAYVVVMAAFAITGGLLVVGRLEARHLFPAAASFPCPQAWLLSVVLAAILITFAFAAAADQAIYWTRRGWRVAGIRWPVAFRWSGELEVNYHGDGGATLTSTTRVYHLMKGWRIYRYRADGSARFCDIQWRGFRK